jgi:hypothetical protein
VRNRILISLFIILAHTAAWGAGSDSSTFLIPGVDFSRLTLEKGAWCRYYVADEALGVVDSTEVYIGVTQREMTSHGDAFWVEIESRPRGGSSADADVLKMLVLEKIHSFAEGDSLGQYVVKLYNKSGIHPPQEEDPKQYKDFSLVIPTTDSTWSTTADVPMGTTAGEFSCTMKHRIVNNDKEVQTGDVRLIKTSRDDFTVWFSDDVPMFHLARCEINRVRRTDVRPRITGIPPSATKDSKTTAELVAFGFDAKPILELRKQ